MLTRKHFERTAVIIKEAVDALDLDCDGEDYLIKEFNIFFMNENPNFDPDRFTAAIKTFGLS